MSCLLCIRKSNLNWIMRAKSWPARVASNTATETEATNGNISQIRKGKE